MRTRRSRDAVAVLPDLVVFGRKSFALVLLP